MLTGGRGILAAFAGLAALFIALGTGAYFGALNAPHYGYQSAHPRSANAEQSDPSQVDRDRAGLPYFAERIASGPDPANRDEREKRDLAAQESMSVWAFWLLVVSALGTVTTMIGTGFLLWQIILTREAVEDTGKATGAMLISNEISQRTAHCQLRAYVGGVDFDISGFIAGQVPVTTWTIRNFGLTPARNVEIVAGRFVTPLNYEYIRFPNKFRFRRDLLPGEEWPIIFKWGPPLGDVQIEQLNRSSASFIYAAIIRYRDIDGRRHYTTIKKAVAPQHLTDGAGPMMNCARGNRSN